MKILNIISSKHVIGLLFLILSVTYVNGAEPSSIAPKELKKNQIKSFPNWNEPPTMAWQIPEARYQGPKLSRALLEQDPSRKLRKTEFIDAIKYGLYKLTRGELEQIFYFADQDRDDLIDQKEWDAFAALFLLPFEACDTNGDYILDEKEYTRCFEADPKIKFIEFRRRFQKNKVSIIMSTVTNRGVNEINFSDYLFIRKALFGWTQCHSNLKFIAKAHFKCALGASIPQKFYSKLEYENIYNTGLRVFGDRNLIELDFITYLKTVYLTFVFGVFNQPSELAELEKGQFLKAVKEDRFPTNFEESEIDQIYELVNNQPTMKVGKVSALDFETFGFFFNLHKLFYKYSLKTPMQLSKGEFLDLLEDPFVNKEILMAIDASYTKFEEQHYQEASLILQKYRLNERDFFYSRFKQDASVTTRATTMNETIYNNYYAIKANNTNREIVFSIFTDYNKDSWGKLNLYRAFQLMNLYTKLTDYTRETNSRIINSETFIKDLPAAYDTVKPAINMRQRSNFVLYKSLPRNIGVDILTFLCLESYYIKFQILTMSSNVNIEETTARIILNDFGMNNMPDTILDLSGKGYDSLHRRVFAPLELAKNTIIVHAVASENMRNNIRIKTHHIKVNNDLSRQYPQVTRRFMNTDRV
jgi:hypothetical protein